MTAQREAQIPSWMVRIEKELVRSSEIQKTVINRLTQYSQPLKPVEVEPTSEKKEETLVPVAQELRNFVEQLRGQSDQYEEMLRCLEV